VNSKQLVQKALPTWNGRLAAHDMSYNSDGHVHRAIPYDATNPAVALQKAQLMQSDGVDLCICTWQGPYAPSCHAAAIAMCNACKQVGLQFALELDPWCAKLSESGQNTNYTANVTAALQYPSTQAMLNASSYVPEKWVLDFTTGADLATLSKTFPTLAFLEQLNGFSWIAIPPVNITDSPLKNAWAVSNLKSQHANPAMKIASFCDSFNDAGQPLPVGVSSQAAFDQAGGNRNYQVGVWGNVPCRVLESFAGQFAQQQLATINPACPVIAILTFSDYDEQSSGPREKVLAEEQGIVWA
jgi:hypothetical protein